MTRNIIHNYKVLKLSNYNRVGTQTEGNILKKNVARNLRNIVCEAEAAVNKAHTSIISSKLKTYLSIISQYPQSPPLHFCNSSLLFLNSYIYSFFSLLSHHFISPESCSTIICNNGMSSYPSFSSVSSYML